MDDLHAELLATIKAYSGDPHNEHWQDDLAHDLAAAWTKPPVAQQVEPTQNKCFECGHELQAPICPACNPELAIVWRDPPIQQPPSEAAPVKMLVDADWLRDKVAADPDMDCEVRPAPAVQELELLADVKELAEYLAGCRRGYGYVVASVLPLDKLLERILTALRTQGGK